MVGEFIVSNDDMVAIVPWLPCRPLFFARASALPSRLFSVRMVDGLPGFLGSSNMDTCGSS